MLSKLEFKVIGDFAVSEPFYDKRNYACVMIHYIPKKKEKIYLLIDLIKYGNTLTNFASFITKTMKIEKKIPILKLVKLYRWIKKEVGLVI